MSQQLVPVSDFRPANIRWDVLTHRRELGLADMARAWRTFRVRANSEEQLRWLDERMREVCEVRK
jgi:hypothetical protein